VTASAAGGGEGFGGGRSFCQKITEHEVTQPAAAAAAAAGAVVGAAAASEEKARAPGGAYGTV
jgi:hypothetical protein